MAEDCSRHVLPAFGTGTVSRSPCRTRTGRLKARFMPKRSRPASAVVLSRGLAARNREASTHGFSRESLRQKRAESLVPGRQFFEQIPDWAPNFCPLSRRDMACPKAGSRGFTRGFFQGLCACGAASGTRGRLWRSARFGLNWGWLQLSTPEQFLVFLLRQQNSSARIRPNRAITRGAAGMPIV